MATIRASVGRGGRNQRTDVKAVQSLLNDHVKPPIRLLAEDGLVGPKTIQAITNFQRDVVRLPRPDGRVDPGYRTIETLSGGRTGRTHTAPKTGGTASPIDQHKAAAREELRTLGKDTWFSDFWKVVVEDATPEVKRFFSMIGRAEDARKIARFYVVLRKDLDVSPREIKQILQSISGVKDPRWTKNFVDFLSDPPTRIGGALKKLAKAGKLVGFVIFLIEYMDHWSKGDYHMAFCEIYKQAMGKAIGWADFIDTIQSFLNAILPKKYKSETAFKVIKAINPIDLGAQAVDVGGVLATMVIEGKIDERRVLRLADRMKKGSAAIFYDLGDDLASALAAIADMSDSDYDEMMSAGSIFGWLNDFWLTKYTPSLVLYRWVKEKV